MLLTSIEAGNAYAKKLSKLGNKNCLEQLEAGLVTLTSDYLAENNEKEVAAGDEKALAAKNDDLIRQRVRFTEFTLAEPGNLPAAIASVTDLRTTCRELASSPELAQKYAWDGVKMLFTNARGNALELSPADAQVFLNFVVAVLHTSAVDTSAVIGSSKGTTAQLSDFYSQLCAELTTHNAKSNHPSAKIAGMFFPAARPLGYLNSMAVDTEVSGASGGGLMRSVAWLLTILPFRMSVAGFEFIILDCLLKEPVRAQLLASGVTSFADMPLISLADKEAKGFENVGSVKMKVDAETSVELKLMPANAMLRASRELVERIQARKVARQVEAGAEVKAALLAEVALIPGATELVQACEESMFSTCFSAAQGDALKAKKALTKVVTDVVKVLNTSLKKGEKLSFNTEFVFEFVKSITLPYIRSIPHVAVVSANIQNAGKAYQDYAARGVPRFNTTPGREKVNPVLVRRFHTLNSQLNDWATWASERKDNVDIATKYDLSSKWLTNRRKQSINVKHVATLSAMYCAKLRTMAEQYAGAPASDLAACTPTSAVQHYVLTGSRCAPDVFTALAKQGQSILKSTDKAVNDEFLAAVVANLTNTKAST